MSFYFVTAASDFNSAEQVNFITADYVKSFESIGGLRVNSADVHPDIALFYFVATGGTENLVLDMYSKRPGTVKGSPVFLIAHPANNSLPASLEILAKLKQDNIPGEIFYLSSASDKKTLLQINQAAHEYLTMAYLKKVKLGVIGKPSDWLVASAPSDIIIANGWGPNAVNVPVSEVLDEMKKINAADTEVFAHELKNKAANIVEPSEKDLTEAVKVYAAMKKIISRYNLDAVTVRCFDIVLAANTTGCFALSALTDEGVTAGCEGDIMSVTAMMWGKSLLDAIPWMANPSRVDEGNNKLWLAHCTVPRNLTKEYILRSHFESGLGVGIQGIIPEGPVTLVRIGGKSMEKLWLAEGVILQNGDADNLCRTQVEIELTNGGHVSDLLTNPLGNHLVLFTGHHMKELSDYHRKWVVNNN